VILLYEVQLRCLIIDLITSALCTYRPSKFGLGTEFFTLMGGRC